MGFTLGGVRELDDADVMLMVGVDRSGRVHGVTSWLPEYEHGALVGWTLDVMRRDRRSMAGTIEFLIAETALRSAARGLRSISLSGTPLAPHDGPADGVGAELRTRGAEWLARFLEPAYGFGSLQRYKEKFGPRHEPLWMAYPDHFDMARVARALALTYVPHLKPKHLVAIGQAHLRPPVAAR
jgi:lysylphosphatidylglycerol synthetase-like protein (DUF2156 family)